MEKVWSTKGESKLKSSTYYTVQPTISISSRQDLPLSVSFNKHINTISIVYYYKITISPDSDLPPIVIPLDKIDKQR